MISNIHPGPFAYRSLIHVLRTQAATLALCTTAALSACHASETRAPNPLGQLRMAQEGQAITLASLLNEMVDREAMAALPVATYACKQASSYDRDSNDPADPDSWYANWDRSHFIRVEERADGGKEYVLMEESGPGAIVRFWSTWHGPDGGEFSNGTLRIYLDGQSTPAIEGPIREVLSGGALTGPPLSDFVSKLCGSAQRAHNLYLPIPYAAGCKVTYQTHVPIDPGARSGEALYYQINYRSYAEGTRVESFSVAALEDARSTLERVQEKLSAPGVLDGPTAIAIDESVPLASGSSLEWNLKGPGAIRELRLQIEAEDQAQALRSTVLEMEFDGHRTIWCPVGDFFGSGYLPRPFETWFTSAAEDGEMVARWVMPFARGAVLRLHNLGEQKIELGTVRARSSAWDWDPERSAYFHTTWHQRTRYQTRTADMSGRGGPRDENYVTIQGEGLYVGDTLTLFDCAEQWWGEGDEKIYVDGESFPSHFGTGTEDYYGYAWCRGEPFAMPFHAQPIGDGNLGIGVAVNNRYRVLDAIPFQKSLRFDMEIWSWANTTMNYAPTTFWYARPGATSNVTPLPDAAREAVALELDDLIPVYRVAGAIEGESLEITRRTGGIVEVQSVQAFGWSGNSQLWWMDASVGDELDLRFNVGEAGRYTVTARLTQAEDYAVVGLSIDGQDVAGAFDRYGAQVSHDNVALGTHDLEVGEHTLAVRILGANKKAVKRHMFGLDYLFIEPRE